MEFISTGSLSHRDLTNISHLCKELDYEAFFEEGDFGSDLFFMAYDNDTLAGYLSLMFWEDKCEVTALVAPDYRRQGIFTRLLSMAHNAYPSTSFTGTFHKDYNLENSSVCRGPAYTDLFMMLESCTSKPLTNDCRIAFNDSVYKLYRGRTLIGSAGIDMTDSFTNVWNVTIKEPYRNRGYGSILMNYLINHYFKNNSKPLFLHVTSTNTAAVRLYEKCGFHIHTAIDNYYL